MILLHLQHYFSRITVTALTLFPMVSLGFPGLIISLGFVSDVFAQGHPHENTQWIQGGSNREPVGHESYTPDVRKLRLGEGGSDVLDQIKIDKWNVTVMRLNYC